MKKKLAELPYWNWKLHSTDRKRQQARSSPCCMVIFEIFNEMWFLTSRPLTRNTTNVADLSATELEEYLRGDEPSRINPNL